MPPRKRTQASQTENRGPGRPPGRSGAQTRERILSAAREVLAEHGYPKATVREIAARASVNPALVHHYFGKKRELHAAVLDRVGTELRERIEALAVPEGSASEQLRALVRTWVQALGHDPYVPRMIVQEVLVPEGEQLETFVSRFPAPIAQRVLPVIAEWIRRGELRPVQLPFLLPSIVGLVVFIFLAAPVVRRLFGLDPTQPEVIEAWAEHAADPLLHGILARPEEDG
jgi:AcrR family transcriptional regulator